MKPRKVIWFVSAIGAVVLSASSNAFAEPKRKPAQVPANQAQTLANCPRSITANLAGTPGQVLYCNVLTDVASTPVVILVQYFERTYDQKTGLTISLHIPEGTGFRPAATDFLTDWGDGLGEVQSGSQKLAVGFADFDSDGKKEIVLPTQDSSGGGLLILKIDRENKFKIQQIRRTVGGENFDIDSYPYSTDITPRIEGPRIVFWYGRNCNQISFDRDLRLFVEQRCR